MKDELEDILEIKEPRKKISPIKKKYWSFKFKLFGRTFYFQTYIEGNIEKLFKPVEPCQANIITATVCQMAEAIRINNETKQEWKDSLNLERDQKRKELDKRHKS